MSSRLLATKFHVPLQRAGLVQRLRLLEELQRGWEENRNLTLVSAPAGYGKTTLVTGWLSHLQSLIKNKKTRISWLSLDETDNDPLRFLRYFLSAFQQAGVSLSEQTLSALEMPPVWMSAHPNALPPIHVLLDDLLNDLAGIDDRLVLVLDDYHVITNLEIHAALEYFIEHQPSSTHLVLTTRSDPPLPLPRLRARRRLTEIRARDLRFTGDESRALFGLANLPLAESALNALNQRTEGWVVGLQLAALALQHQHDRAAFIETFHGSHRYVLDYLAGEVIQQQDEEIRTFLAQTSLLDRFNAELCNTITGRADSQAIIIRLEQSNLFIIPLDDERRWYRYHHLFADYLKTLLPGSEKVRFYKAAAEWHFNNHLISEAMSYALASADPDFTANVLEHALSSDTTWSNFDLGLFSSWLEALPARVLQGRPELSLGAARIFYLARRFEAAQMHIEQAELVLTEKPLTKQTEQLRSLARLYRGSLASVRGDSQQAIEQISSAQESLDPENHLAHSRAFFGLGLSYKLAGLTEQAKSNYLRSADEAKAAQVDFIVVHALCNAAQVLVTQGQLNSAEQICQQALQFARAAGRAHLGLPLTLLAGLALERSELGKAEQLLQEGLAVSRKSGLTDDIVLGMALLARLRAAQGDTESALAAMQDAHALTQAQGIPRLSMFTAANLARLQLYAGQTQAAMRWAAEYRSTHAGYLREFEDLTLARILLAGGEEEAVPGILHTILDKAEAAERKQTCLEAMLLLGLYSHARGETAAALRWLEKSLRLAAPEGYLRIFLDEGPPLLELLPEARHAAPEFVDALLNASQTPTESHMTLLEELPDPLSEQEIRVLKLIVAGKSNAEIAAELVISVGTAKWHVHNILQKLGVGNRPKAIARARELGM